MDPSAFDEGYQVAAFILFPLALSGFICNFTVIVFLRVIPSLNNSFGSLTLSQAIADCIHQAIFAFYLAPCMFLRNDDLYSVSEQFGFTLITVYNIGGMAHVCISLNRFFAVYTPFYYTRIFSIGKTRVLIAVYWLIGIASTTYLLKMIDCYNHLAKGAWGFGFADTATCNIVLWRVEFVRYIIYVAIVAVLDFSSIVTIHLHNRRHNLLSQDAVSAARTRMERMLVYQAALQGVMFLLELITYFIISPYAQNKWVFFLLTTVSWCLVHGIDGFIVLSFNRDFRRQVRKIVTCRFHSTPAPTFQLQTRESTGNNATHQNNTRSGLPVVS